MLLKLGPILGPRPVTSARVERDRFPGPGPCVPAKSPKKTGGKASIVSKSLLQCLPQIRHWSQQQRETSSPSSSTKGRDLGCPTHLRNIHDTLMPKQGMSKQGRRTGDKSALKTSPQAPSKHVENMWVPRTAMWKRNILSHTKKKHSGLPAPFKAYELASKIYAWSVFVSLLSVPYRFPWFWILQVCIHTGIVFCQSPIVFQGKSRKQHRDETSLTKVVDDNFEVASYRWNMHRQGGSKTSYKEHQKRRVCRSMSVIVYVSDPTSRPHRPFDQPRSGHL